MVGHAANLVRRSQDAALEQGPALAQFEFLMAPFKASAYWWSAVAMVKDALFACTSVVAEDSFVQVLRPGGSFAAHALAAHG